MAETNTGGQHPQQPASSTSTGAQSTADADGPEIMARIRLPSTATELGTNDIDHFTPEEGR